MVSLVPQEVCDMNTYIKSRLLLLCQPEVNFSHKIAYFTLILLIEMLVNIFTILWQLSSYQFQMTGEVQKVANELGKCRKQPTELVDWNTGQYFGYKMSINRYSSVTIVKLSIKHLSVTIVNLILRIVNLTLFTDNRQFDTLKLWPLGPLRAGLTVGTVVLSYTLCGVAIPHPSLTPLWGGGRGMGAWLNNRPCGSHTNCKKFVNFV